MNQSNASKMISSAFRNLIYICFGMPRSGSTFAFQLTVSAIDSLRAQGIYLNRTTAELLNDAGIPFDGESYIHGSDDLERTVDRLLSEAAHDIPFAVVLKTHATCSVKLAELLARGDVFASAVYRDPLEVAESLINVSSKEAEIGVNRFDRYSNISDTIDGIRESIAALHSWTQNCSVLRMSFNDLTSSPESYLAALSAQLNYKIDIDYIASWFQEDKSGRIGEYSAEQKKVFRGDIAGSNIFEIKEKFSEYYALVNGWTGPQTKEAACKQFISSGAINKLEKIEVTNVNTNRNPEETSQSLGLFIAKDIRPRNFLQFGGDLELVSYLISSSLVIETSYRIDRLNTSPSVGRNGLQLLNIDLFCEAAPTVLNQKFDLVLATEVADHISLENHEALCDFLAARAVRWVIFSSARAGQGIVGDITKLADKQWQTEWESRGFQLDKRMTIRARSANSMADINLHRNLLVFRASSNFDVLNQLEVDARPYLADLLGIVLKHATVLERNIFFVDMREALGGMPADALRVKRDNLLTLSKYAKNILHIGFNAGYLTLLFLLSSADSKITVADSLIQSCAQDCFNYLRAMFPGRLELIPKDSTSIVERSMGRLFDLIHVGSGKESTLEPDLVAMRKLVQIDHVLIIDDTQEKILNSMVHRLERQGRVCFSAFARRNSAAARRRWKHTIGRFVWNEEEQCAAIQTSLNRIFEVSNFRAGYLHDIPGSGVTCDARVTGLLRAMRAIENSQVTGAVVEVGVAAGHSSVICALTLSRFIAREFWLFDTFVGFAGDLPDERDHQDNKAIHDYDLSRYEADECSEDMVRTRMLDTGMLAESLHLVKGSIEQTAAAFSPDEIAVLKLNVELFEPTMAALRAFYDHVKPGGYLIIDNYGHLQECRAAVDQFFAERKDHFLGQPLGDTCYVARKMQVAATSFLSDQLDAARYDF